MNYRGSVRVFFGVSFALVIVALSTLFLCSVPCRLPTDYLVLVDLTYSVNSSDSERYLASLQHIMQNECDSADFLLVYGFNEGQILYCATEFESKADANRQFPLLRQQILDGRHLLENYNRWTIFVNGCNAIWTDYSHREYSHQTRRRVVLVLSDCITELPHPFPEMEVRAVERVDWCFSDTTYLKFLIGIDTAQMRAAEGTPVGKNLFYFGSFYESELDSFKEELNRFQLSQQEPLLSLVGEVGIVRAVVRWLQTPEGMFTILLLALLGTYSAMDGLYRVVSLVYSRITHRGSPPDPGAPLSQQPDQSGNPTSGPPSSPPPPSNQQPPDTPDSPSTPSTSQLKNPPPESYTDPTA